MQRVLITGATGFIGGHLAEALVQRDIEVRCLVRPTSDARRLSEIGASLVEGDLRQAGGLDAAVADVDCVFHLAGLITALQRADLAAANGSGAGRVAAACAECSPPPKLIVVSSVAAAGPAARDQIRHEHHPLNPVSDYGRSKRHGELSVAEWADQVKTTIIRPGIVFGPRDRLTLPIFKTVATWGIHPTVGLGRAKIALLHVSDLIDLLLKAADAGEQLPGAADRTAQPGTGCYFASHDRTPTYREFGVLIARAMQRRVVPVPMLPPVAWSAAAVNQLWSQVRRRPNAFNLDKIREAVQPSWAISNQKAKSQLGWQPEASLEAQIEATVNWYQAHQWIKIRRIAR